MQFYNIALYVSDQSIAGHVLYCFVTWAHSVEKFNSEQFVYRDIALNNMKRLEEKVNSGETSEAYT